MGIFIVLALESKWLAPGGTGFDWKRGPKV